MQLHSVLKAAREGWRRRDPVSFPRVSSCPQRGLWEPAGPPRPSSSAPTPCHWSSAAPPRPIAALCAKFESLFLFESGKRGGPLSAPAPSTPGTQRRYLGGPAGHPQGRRRGERGLRRRWARARGLSRGPCSAGRAVDASGHVAGSSPCGLGLHLREPWTHWWRCGRLDLGKSGRHRGRGRSRRDPSRLCGDPRRERGGGPAHSGLGLGVSVGTTKRRDYGGRRLARGSLGGARCWRRPGDSPGCGWISHRCVCRGGRASVNCTSNSNWSLTRDFLALCRHPPPHAACSLFVVLFSGVSLR